jgi:hypothetical protein
MGSTLRLHLPAPVTDDGVQRLCAGLRLQLSARTVAVVVCSVDPAAQDLATVDAVARLALVARRAGVGFTVDEPGGELTALLELAGLRTVVTDR